LERVRSADPELNAYSDGLRPRYTYVSKGHVIVQGNGGELFVLRHSLDWE
jgi:hypothetical protein